ncbi:LytTr DNA-binding domain-containing protein [Lutimaribacter pacificus]|uniref:LytTr DNA-binding domain-containing protein n=1 Tax=Lutimaribacter pacificus TaxID=391948 RepID=A0A1H0BH63_9RHOB|nr:LytTR family DNA-binding domain-containing protein [Lutimaribacter pacificus]SDN44987.1 LytTr DNA-binding domain-containing protein [Lutimaribacter pacificus]SHJ56142.1 LytTr DNA-binding domain-containing protein [Lutimaribacter pacificus]
MKTIPGTSVAMPIVLINGTKIQGSVRDIWSVLTDAQSIVFYLIAGAVFGYLYPSDHLTGLEWWAIATCVLFAITVLIIALGSYLSLFVILSRRIDWLVAPVPVILLTSVVTMEMTCRPFAFWVWGAEWLSNSDLGRLIATNYLVFLSFEILFSAFVFPTTRRGKTLLAQARLNHLQSGDERLHIIPVEETVRPTIVPADGTTASAGKRSAAPATVTETSGRPGKESREQTTSARRTELVVGSESFRFEALRMIRAEEHYVRITTTTGVHLLRFRFSDAISQLPDEVGIQVHRSYWLSYDAIAGRRRLPDSRTLVTLWNGETVTVPRARRKQLEAALMALPAD